MKCVTKVTITWEAEEDVPEQDEIKVISELADDSKYAEMEREFKQELIDKLGLDGEKVRNFEIVANAYLE